MGYTVDYRVVDTADYGVPQFRKRFVLLGSRYKRHPIELPEVTHASPEVSVRQNKLAWNTVRTAFAGIPELQNGGTDPNIPLHTCSHIGELAVKYPSVHALCVCQFLQSVLLEFLTSNRELTKNSLVVQYVLCIWMLVF